MSIKSERVGHVAVVTLNRPEKRNALNAAMSEAFAEALTGALHDTAVRVVVLTAEGPAFSAGMDLAEFSSSSVPSPKAEATNKMLMEFIRGTYPKPLVAGVNGPAVGGGFELVLACDLVVAATTATFGLPEVRRGLFAGGNGTLLPRRIPRALALEVGLTGEPFGAERAHQLGLVNRVVPAADVRAESLALAERIAANGPLAVQTTRQLMHLAAEAGAEREWEAVAAAWAVVTASEDAKEGARAYLEKRSPSWSGR
jgi:enoyl-CoA hydratase/carnithine racemase